MGILKEFTVDKLNIKIMNTRSEMGSIAADMVGEKIKELLAKKDEMNIIFAAAPSQNEFLEALITIKGIEWSRINAFHMDEYIGLDKNAPQGFGNFLKDKIFSKVNFKSVNYLSGQAENIKNECKRYEELLKSNPTDIVCMGIGENGHIAFNDPWVADFNDKNSVKVVKLDEICRQQQVNDGCFNNINDVPVQALTLTIHSLISAEYIFCVVPAKTKCKAVYNTVRGSINTNCPASILRKHNDAILFCDSESGRDILFRKAIITDEISQDFEEAVGLAQKYGCEAVEIRSIWDKSPHELDGKDIEQINIIAKSHNLKICAISSSVFKCNMDDKSATENQFEVFEKCAVLANKTGAKYVRIFTFWYNNEIEKDIDFIIREISKLSLVASKYDITLLIEIDPSVSITNADEMSILFNEINLPNVKILWDPGNQIYNKEYKIPYPNGYELIKEYISHIHLKDAIRNGVPEGVALGNGILNIKGQLKALLRDNYDGYIVLEPHFRMQSKLSENKLLLPGGSGFSKGGYEASELSFIQLEKIINDLLA